MRRLTAFTVASFFAVSCGSAAQSVTGTAGLAAGYLETGGPDVSHQREDSAEGLSFWGGLSLFGERSALQFEWRGLGAPDAFLRGAAFRPHWRFEGFAQRRSYLAGGDVRFAWDPESGALDLRAIPMLAAYRPDPSGSPIGAFNPATLAALSDVLPSGAPGWRQDEFGLSLSTRSLEKGFSVALNGTVRDATLPRTFPVATGFTPIYLPFLLDGPIGNELGVLEVPERTREKTVALEVRAFQKSGPWRWEEDLSLEDYRLARLVTSWESPFPGPSLSEPGAFSGVSGKARLLVRGKGVWASLQRDYAVGRGEAGSRTREDTRLRAGLEHQFTNGVRLFAESGWRERSDRVRLEDQGLHPVFQGPYYDLFLGPYPALAFPRTNPWRAFKVSIGAEAKAWEARVSGTDSRYPNLYGRHKKRFEARLRWTPATGLDFILEPAWTRVSDLNPDADFLDPLGNAERQSSAFLPTGARNWRSLSFTTRWRRGPFVASYSREEQRSSDAPGLRGRRSQTLFSGLNAERGLFSFGANARLNRSDLDLAATTYGGFFDAPDPLDPSHRLPLAEHWERRAQAVSAFLERRLREGSVGFEGRWNREASETFGVLDSPRSFSFWRAAFFAGRSFGPVQIHIETGLEGYASDDPLFRPATSPGPYLWAGLGERPGRRAFAVCNFSYRF